MKSLSRKRIIVAITSLFATFSWINAEQVEQTITVPAIYPRMQEIPEPQGCVDENSPWLHFRIPIEPVKKNQPTELAHRLYFFELSQDSTFTNGVIRSEAKRWSFYNPYRILEVGDWYWRYGVALDSDPKTIRWSDRSYQFRITGRERKVLPPTPKQLLERVSTTKGPHVTMLSSEVGKLMTALPSEQQSSLSKSFERLLNDHSPIKVVVDTTDYPKHLTPDGIHRYYTLKTLKQFTDLANRIRMTLNAYLLTGDVRYKEKGLREFYDLDREYHSTMMKYGKRKGYPDDFALEQHIKTMNLVLDGFADDLTPEWREKVVELLFQIKREGYLNFYKQLEYSEHVVYKAHLWQMGVYTLLSSAVVLAPYKEEARLWMEYAYELWLYRNPAASRLDGGWHADNGYFGANERQLTFTPLFLGKLMNYDYFSHPWYSNVAKYLSYSAPIGNPGVAFGDAVGYTGCTQSNLVEVLAYTHPQNYWNLWRMKTMKELLKNEKKEIKLASEAVWSLLSVWSKYSEPDYAMVETPKELAALFQDIGYVGMHTNLAEPDKNLLVNFRSCPFGQTNHAHPAQNAFNVAYGSEPLFWRTGYYGVAADHQAEDFKHSRAHNTILADGIGQLCDVSGYGWIPRFVTGEKISYALGDASHAYSHGGVSEKEYKEPGVTRFRRHLALLRPNFIVIYDELEAKNPIQWTFRLNALNPMTQEGANILSTFNKQAKAVATLFSNTPISTEVTDQFVAAPIDTQGKRKDGKDRSPNQWHASLSTIEKQPRTRFLMVIEVTPEGERKFYTGRTKKDKEGMMVIDLKGYRLRAQLDPSRPSFLEITNEQEQCGLVTGQGARSLTIGGQNYSVKSEGATLFVERGEQGVMKVIEKIDTLPDVMIYGNRY